MKLLKITIIWFIIISSLIWIYIYKNYYSFFPILSCKEDNIIEMKFKNLDEIFKIHCYNWINMQKTSSIWWTLWYKNSEKYWIKLYWDDNFIYIWKYNKNTKAIKFYWKLEWINSSTFQTLEGGEGIFTDGNKFYYILIWEENNVEPKEVLLLDHEKFFQQKSKEEKILDEWYSKYSNSIYYFYRTKDNIYLTLLKDVNYDKFYLMSNHRTLFAKDGKNYIFKWEILDYIDYDSFSRLWYIFQEDKNYVYSYFKKVDWLDPKNTVVFKRNNIQYMSNWVLLFQLSDKDWKQLTELLKLEMNNKFLEFYQEEVWKKQNWIY